MNKFYKIMSEVITVILILIVCLLMYVFVQVNLMKKDYANIFGYTYFQVITGSMEPTIQIDDIVFIKLTSDINQNDIVTYKSDGNYITHRVIEINDDYVITKGDNNNSEDEPISKDQIIGKVAYTINDVAVWKKVFKDIRVIIPLALTILLFFTLVIYSEKENKD